MYEAVADLPLTVDSVDRRRLERETTSGFTRVSTEVSLRGAGARGRGEDVSYFDADQDRFAELALPLSGEYTMDSFSARLDDLTLFPEPPEQPAARKYRRWALESAGLDLALEQAGRTLGEALDRRYDPVRFVVSTRLGDPDGEAPPTTDPLEALLAVHPDLEFKLDPTPAWDDRFVDAVAALDAVRVLDLKGRYEGTPVDAPADPELYRRVLTAFPDALVEDPRLTDATRPLFAGEYDRVSWDAPVTGVDAIEALPVEPAWLNCKPSRFGTVESLLETVARCERRGIRLYGGGQFELGVGRAQIQALASLLYPDAPNDVAPRVYNDPNRDAAFPGSPLSVREPSGLGWAQSAR